MSNHWRAILEPKNKELPTDEVYTIARHTGYPFFSCGGKIYTADADAYREAPTRPEVLDEPQVFAVMDKTQKKLLMLAEGLPFLCVDISAAITLANRAQGVVKPLGEALWLNREAMKNESPIIAPPGAGEIVAARG